MFFLSLKINLDKIIMPLRNFWQLGLIQSSPSCHFFFASRDALCIKAVRNANPVNHNNWTLLTFKSRTLIGGIPPNMAWLMRNAKFAYQSSLSCKNHNLLIVSEREIATSIEIPKFIQLNYNLFWYNLHLMAWKNNTLASRPLKNRSKF